MLLSQSSSFLAIMVRVTDKACKGLAMPKNSDAIQHYPMSHVHKPELATDIMLG